MSDHPSRHQRRKTGAGVLNVKAAEILDAGPAYGHPDEDCVTLWLKMEERGLASIPIVDEEMRLVGIVRRATVEARYRTRLFAELVARGA